MLTPAGKRRLTRIGKLSHKVCSFSFCYFVAFCLKSQVLIYILAHAGTSLKGIYLHCKQMRRHVLFKSQQFFLQLKITGAESLAIIWLTNGCEK
jgi:hypothetical protein